MLDVYKQISLIKACLIGGLLGFAFWHSYIWWFAVVGGVGFFLLIPTFKTARVAFWHGWIVGAVKILIVTAWVWGAYPLDWMGFESEIAQIFLIGSFWLLAALTLGSGYALLAAAVHYVLRRHQTWTWPSLILGFLLADIWGSFLLSVVMLGPGSSLNISYSNGWLGYTLAEHGLLIFAARFGGVFMLSLLYGLLVMVLYKLWRENQRIIIAALLLGLVLTSSLSVSLPTVKLGKTVAVVNTSFERTGVTTEEVKDNKTRVYNEVMQALAMQSVDYVVWPEDTRFFNLLKDVPNKYTYLQQILGNEAIVVDTARNDTEGTVLRAYIYDMHIADTYSFDKQYLVPQGEYIPYLYRLPINLIGLEGRLEQVIGGMSYQPGIDQATVKVPDYVPAVLFCFESMDPTGVRRVLQGRTDVPFVAHVISHARFHESPNILWHELDAMLRVQAVWNQVPIVQAANKAFGTVYEPDGFSRRLLPDAAGEQWYVSYLKI